MCPPLQVAEQQIVQGIGRGGTMLLCSQARRNTP